MNRLGPLDKLENGTRVVVGDKLCTVISSKKVAAQPTGEIVVHVLEQYAIKKRTGPGRSIVVDKKGKPFECNYSAILY